MHPCVRVESMSCVRFRSSQMVINMDYRLYADSLSDMFMYGHIKRFVIVLNEGKDNYWVVFRTLL